MAMRELPSLRYADFIYGNAPELKPILEHCRKHFAAIANKNSDDHFDQPSRRSFARKGSSAGYIRRVEHVDAGTILGTISGTKLEAATLTFRSGQADFGRI